MDREKEIKNLLKKRQRLEDTPEFKAKVLEKVSDDTLNELLKQPTKGYEVILDGISDESKQDLQRATEATKKEFEP